MSDETRDDDDLPDDEPPLPSEMPSVDASSIGEVRKRERRKKREARESEEFWKAVFATPIGRREMYRILAEAGTFEQRFAVGPTGFPDALASWYHRGAHDFGQRVYQGWLMRMPQEVVHMRAENDPNLPDDLRKKVLKPDG